MQKIVDLAEKYFLPIIADEVSDLTHVGITVTFFIGIIAILCLFSYQQIYEHFVFPGTDFISVSSLSKTVPVLSCGGLTKRFLVPGWRIGWIVIHDRYDVFDEVRNVNDTNNCSHSRS